MEDMSFLNVVLNFISLYLFSYYKAPKVVVFVLIKIQKTFIWKGEETKRQINGVSWSTMCKSKVGWGLSLKYCEIFNVALLNKWAWKIVDKQDSWWFQLLSFKYGYIKGLLLDSARVFAARNSSIWWRDLRGIVTPFVPEESWFRKDISCKLGTWSEIYFRRIKWLDPQPLKDLFPTMFESLCDQRVTVSNTCEWYSKYLS